MDVPSVIHKLIIRHPTEATVVLTAGQRLPSFVTPDRHTAEVDYINQLVRERLGLVSTVLRSLHHGLETDAGGVVRVHECEVHGEPTPAASATWRAVAAIAGDDAADLAAWRDAPADGSDGRGWTQPGWFAEACDWIVRQLDTIGAGRPRAIVQLRAWPSSCVLRVETAQRHFYFKAVAPGGAAECTVTDHLARHSTLAPRVLAIDAPRRWLLMADCGGVPLETIADADAWASAAARYARLQVVCMWRTAELRALGCAERQLPTLAAEIEVLAADTPALQPAAAEALSAAEVADLRARLPELRRRCATLAALPIPPTIEHGDLWPGNVLVDGDACAVIDWEDAAIAHPFFSLAPLLVGLGLYQPALDTAAVRRRIADAYLAPFAGAADAAGLHTALRLAAPLGFLDMALRYRGQRASVVRLHPWMRGLVPQTVRLALAALRAGDPTA